MKTPVEIIQLMLQHDEYSAWLGLQIISISAGECTLKAQMRNEMCNGHKHIHGGISYALSDSALAFASNSYGKKAVSIETQISHVAPIFVEDEITAVAKEINHGNNISRYEVNCYNQNKQLVSTFKGTVFVKNEFW